MYMHQSSLLAEPSQSIVDPKYAPHLLIDKLHSLVQRIPRVTIKDQVYTLFDEVKA